MNYSLFRMAKDARTRPLVMDESKLENKRTELNQG